MKNKITMVVTSAFALTVAALAIIAFAKLPINSYADGIVSGNSVEAQQIMAEQRNDKFVADIGDAANKAIQQATFMYAIASANGTQVTFPQNPLTVAAGAVPTYPTAVVTTDYYQCFNQKMFDKVKANPLLNYEIHYVDDAKKKHVLVIPALADYSLVRADNGFYGFNYLRILFGGYDE